MLKAGKLILTKCNSILVRIDQDSTSGAATEKKKGKKKNQEKKKKSHPLPTLKVEKDLQHAYRNN